MAILLFGSAATRFPRKYHSSANVLIRVLNFQLSSSLLANASLPQAL
jgi:hypothetical protein